MFRKNGALACFLLALCFSLPTFAQSVAEIFHAPHDPLGGNPNGPVTMVEFFDYQCSHCQNMVAPIAELAKNNPNLRIVYKEFPIRGPISEYAARAALAANLQGKFVAMHQALFATNLNLTNALVLDIAKKVGLNIAKLTQDMKSSLVTYQLNADLKLGNILKISGTPAFIFGKTNETDVKKLNYVLGEMSQQEMQQAISKA